MKVLIVSDTESKSLWDFYDKSKLEDVELILSCGDLSPKYLSFLVTMSTATLLYIHGNHDLNYAYMPPEGCICIEDKVYNYKGLRILGLGGSMRYKPDTALQYSEREMARRIRRMKFSIMRKRGFDILLTHSPAYELNDGEDWPHRGYACFLKLMDKYKPRYFIHGHVHLNYGSGKRCDKYGETMVINGYESYVIDVEPENGREKKDGRNHFRFKRRSGSV